MSRKKQQHITDQQLEVLRGLIAGKTFAEIKDETGVPIATAKRWKTRFSGILQEHDDAVSTMLLEARTATIGLMLDHVGLLRQMLASSDDIHERLAVVDRVHRAFSLLNPPSANSSVAVNATPDSEQSRVVVLLPSNGRGDEYVAR